MRQDNLMMQWYGQTGGVGGGFWVGLPSPPHLLQSLLHPPQGHTTKILHLPLALSYKFGLNLKVLPFPYL